MKERRRTKFGKEVGDIKFRGPGNPREAISFLDAANSIKESSCWSKLIYVWVLQRQCRYFGN